MVGAWIFCLAAAQGEEGKIVGGSPATIEQFPAAVQLRICGSLCAGSLITPTKVLTAAHCFGASADRSCITATVAQTESVAVSGVTTGKSYSAASFVVNPSYTDVSSGFDSAIITLSQPVTLGSGSAAPQLARLAAYDAQTSVIGAGWGTTMYKGSVSSSLLQVPLSPARCYPPGFPTTVMCVGTPGTNGKDTCQGDSGGALWARDSSGALIQIALVSYGPVCGSYDTSNGKYTNIAAVLGWISSQAGLSAAALTTPPSAPTTSCPLGTPALVAITPTTWAASFSSCGAAADSVTVALQSSGGGSAQATADVSAVFYAQPVSALLRIPAAPPAGGNVTATFSAKKGGAAVPVSPAAAVVATVAQAGTAVSVAYPSSGTACLQGACAAGSGAVSAANCPSGAAAAAAPHTVACGCLACPGAAGGGAPVLAVTRSGARRQPMDAATCTAVYTKLACAVGLYSYAGYTCECSGVPTYNCPFVSCDYTPPAGTPTPSGSTGGGGGGGGGTPTYTPSATASAWGLLGLLALLALLPLCLIILCICCACRRRRTYRPANNNRPAFRQCPPSPPPIVIPTPAPGPYDVVVGGVHPWVDVPPAAPGDPMPPHQTGIVV